VSTAELLRFYAPLAATTMFYAIIFNVMNSAMARTAEAAAALAAFAVGQSVADMLAVPAGSGHQWLIARGRDRKSFMAGLRVMFQIIGLVTALLTLAAFTPAGRWLYQGILGAPETLSGGIVAVIRVCLPLGFIFTLRGASQSVLMLRRQTHLMTIGVCIRLGYVFLAAMVFGKLPWHGAAIGGLIWVTSMFVEGSFDFLMARRLFRELPEGPADGAAPPEAARIWRFLLPLIATSLLWSFGKPVLNMGMARSLQPETSMAVYQVAWNAAWLLIAYVQGSFRQVIVVFWNDETTLRSLQRFAVRLAVTVSTLMLTLTLSGVATWFLRSVVGAAEEIVQASRGVLMVMSTLPLALVATEVCIGRLLRNGTTEAIGVAKGANLACMSVAAFGLAALAPGLNAMIGALGMLAGVAGELAVGYLAVRRIGHAPAAGDG
jgi:hypothetical protein